MLSSRHHLHPLLVRALPAALIAFSVASIGLPARGQDATTPQPPGQTTPAASTPVEALMRNLGWRAIGPAIMGGRIDDFAVVETDPRIVYVATAAGGLMKTTNHGTTWEMVFENEVTSSIGDVTVAPSNPDVVWVGTGEANNRQSSSWGYGVYRSTDAGKTWKHLGLAETAHIARIVVHPTNPDVAYVAAVGKLWGPNPERGVYKTSDGGQTWEKVLYVNDDTGCTDLLMDPTNPDTIYAATYQRRRTAFGFAGGGPGAGLHRSTDGGKTWKKLEGGLPTGTVGRIGLSMYRKDPKIVYATFETRNSGSTQNTLSGGIYRTMDGGETWEKRSDTNPRPMYFSQIAVDPNNPEKVWMLGVQTYLSTDGGKRFANAIPQQQRVHADGHAIWVNPKDSDHVILGTDGGVQWSWDGGKTWDYANNIPISQFYEVHFDYRQPYWVYGGLQDNGTWGAPNLLPSTRGVTNDEWINVGGGDGFYAQADPTDPNIIYTESQQGAVRRLNVATGEGKSIRPIPTAGQNYRFDWNSPIFISPHNPKKVLFAGNRLFISYDRGDTWRSTDDLTTNTDRTKLPIMGAPVTRTTLSANDGVDSFGQIVTVTESPVKAGVIYVGTDDGNLQVSQDDGKTWKNVVGNVPGLPKGHFVSRVHASAHAPGRCYASFDGHRSDDFKPYVYVTDDFGQTWKPIASNLPEGGTISVIRDHPRTANLLFVGTERGAYVSFNRGVKWERFGAPFPISIPVDDIQVHPRDNDLIFATHARGIWVLDDLGRFEALANANTLPTAPVLAPPKPQVHYRLANRKGVTGNKIYVAPNPPTTAAIHIYLPSEPTGEVKLAITDKSGKKIRDLSVLTLSKGWNRIVWDMRYPAPVTPAATGGGPGGGGGGGGFGGGGGNRGQRVLPGEYQVRLTVGTTEQAQPIRIYEDPRITLTDKERKAIFEASERLGKAYATADEARRSLARTRTQLEGLKAPADLQPQVNDLIKRITILEGQIALTRRPGAGGGPGGGGPGAGGPPGGGGESESEAPQPAPVQPVTVPITLRATRILASLDNFTEPLSQANMDASKAVMEDIKRVVREANEINIKQIGTLNKSLQKASIPVLKPEPKIAEM